MLFICTANQLDTIPGPLLDRMDVIQLSGYTEEEKLQIAKRYLVPKQLEAHGLKAKQVRSRTTRCDDHPRVHARGGPAQPRAADRRRLPEDGDAGSPRARASSCGSTSASVREALGPRRFAGEVRKRTSDPGVATGLAVTAVGGDVLFIEATAYPGKGRLQVTGQLGEVMQESAHAALSWVRSHAERARIDRGGSRARHAHPRPGRRGAEGRAVRRGHDGDRDRLARDRPTVSDDVGMTGEITLTGQVLPIGGVREKVLAAQRAGLKRVILPRENEADLSELPAETRDELEFVLADNIDEVLEQRSTAAAAARPRPGAERQQRLALAAADAALLACTGNGRFPPGEPPSPKPGSPSCRTSNAISRQRQWSPEPGSSRREARQQEATLAEPLPRTGSASTGAA